MHMQPANSEESQWRWNAQLRVEKFRLEVLTSKELKELTKVCKRNPEKWFLGYKHVHENLRGPFYIRQHVAYVPGFTITESAGNKDKKVSCGAGISLWSADKGLRESEDVGFLLPAAFQGKDLLCVPKSMYKFRVKRVVMGDIITGPRRKKLSARIVCG